jgi:transposase
LLRELQAEWNELEARIEEVTGQIEAIAKENEECQRLMEIPGFGPLVSTALTAAVGNAATFHKGRDLAAWLGLVPRQHSTGGKTRLLGISKCGSEYLRRMMLHGARSVVMHMARKKSALGAWVEQLSARTHRNVAVVALANKMARIAWVILNKSERYRPAALTRISLGPAAAT